MTPARTHGGATPTTTAHSIPRSIRGHRQLVDAATTHAAAGDFDQDIEINPEVAAAVEAVVQLVHADQQNDRPTQVVVVGAVGSGVSTVLRVAARRCGALVLTAPAGAGCEGSRGMERLLVAWLRAGGVPEQLLPVDHAELARLWVRHCAVVAPTLLVDDLGADHRWGAQLATWCPRGVLLIGTHLTGTAENLAKAGFAVVQVPPPTDDELVATITTRVGDGGPGDARTLAAACGGDRRNAVLVAAALAAGESAADVLAALDTARVAPPAITGAGAGPEVSWDPVVAMVLGVVDPGVANLVRRVAAVGGAAVSVEALAADLGDEHPDATTVARQAAWAGLLEETSPGRCRLPARVQAVFGTVTGGWLDLSPGRLDDQARAALRGITGHYLLRLAAADVLLGGRTDHRLHPAYAHAATHAHTLLGGRKRAREWMLAEHDTLAALSEQLHHAVRDGAVGEFRVERELLAGLGEAERAWRCVGDRHSWQGVTRRALHAATAVAPHIARFVHATHYADAMLTGGHPLTASDHAHVDQLLAAAHTAASETDSGFWRARALCLRAFARPATAAQDLAAAHDLVNDTDIEAAARVALAWACEALRRGPAPAAIEAAEKAVTAGSRIGGPVGSQIECVAAIVRAIALLTIDPAQAVVAAHHVLDRLHAPTIDVGEHVQLLSWWAHHLAATALDRTCVPWPAIDLDTSAAPCPHCTRSSPRQRAAAHRAVAAVIGPGWTAPPDPAPARSTDAATTAATAAATLGGSSTSFPTYPADPASFVSSGRRR